MLITLKYFTLFLLIFFRGGEGLVNFLVNSNTFKNLNSIFSLIVNFFNIIQKCDSSALKIPGIVAQSLRTFPSLHLSTMEEVKI